MRLGTHLPTLSILALTMTALTAVGAGAQATKTYGKEAGWEILVKDDMGPGCLITKSNPDDQTQLQMGIDATGPLKGYIAIYTKKGANVAAGQKLSVTFDVDGQQFTGEARGQEAGDYIGAFAWVNSPEFIYDLAKRYKLTITSPGRRTLVVDLTGTNAAFKKLRECQNNL